MQTQYYCSAQAAFWFGPQGRFQKRVKGARTALSACVAGFWGKTARTWLAALLFESGLVGASFSFIKLAKTSGGC